MKKLWANFALLVYSYHIFLCLAYYYGGESTFWNSVSIYGIP